MLLGTEAFRSALSDDLKTAKRKVLLISAYLTKNGIDWISNRLTNDDVECNIVSRWKVTDLLSKASDLDAYEIISKRGWKLHILNDLHAKIYLVDKTSLFVGSANLTAYGLSLVPGGNREIGVKISPDEKDVTSLKGIFEESTCITPEIYQEMKEFINNLKPQMEGEETYEWPLPLQEKLQNKNSRLWVADLLWSDSPEEIISKDGSKKFTEENTLHDLAILGLRGEGQEVIESDVLLSAFLNSKAWKWLEGRIKSSSNHEIQFGRATELLHSALLDDPTPYRKDVKGLLGNLFSWIKYLKPSNVRIDVPGSHSERISLIK